MAQNHSNAKVARVATEFPSQPPRFAARSRILTDGKISDGAKVLFLFLDDHVKGQPTILMRQRIMAGAAGVQVRELQYRLSELCESGYLISERSGRTGFYRFGWSKSTSKHAQLCVSDTHGYAPFEADTRTDMRIAPYIQEKLQEPPTPLRGNHLGKTPEAPECSACGGSGRRPTVRVVRGLETVEYRACGCITARVK